MKLRITLFALMVAAGAIGLFLMPRQQPPNVSLIQLIATPWVFDGRRVHIIGFVRLESEGDAIYLHRDDEAAGIQKNGLWLDVNGLSAQERPTYARSAPMNLGMKLRVVLFASLYAAVTVCAGQSRQGDSSRTFEPYPPSAASTPSSPTTLAKVLFESHELFWTELPPPSLYSPIFERLLRLNSECVSAGDSCAIDWDFWSSSQDRGELRLERVRRISSSPGKQIVEMIYRCDCGPAGIKRLTAQIAFSQIGRDWRIDDIKRGRTSVREVLSRYFAAFTETTP